MFRNFAMVMLALAATALWSASADARGGRHGCGGCGGGGCGSHGSCGGGGHGYGGGCGSGGCGQSYGGCATGSCGYTGGCATCGAVAPAASACPGGVCPIGPRKVAAAPAPAPGYIVVTLPANARLSFDDVPTSAATDTRTFVTPQLNAGYEYTYTLKAEIVRDGKVETLTKKVTVTAGAERKISLTAPVEAVAAK